ncbi:MAG TPA: FecR domain-containing protein, partial [Draconibacterium sp.]|nr:FecR domain-containing protein [Draconibacterium sp.]
MKPAFLNHIIIVTFFITCLSYISDAQKIGEIKITETFQNQPLKDFLNELQDKYGLKVFYKESWVEPFSITRTFENTPLLQALNNVFYNHELTYSLFQDDGIIVFRKSMDVRSKFDEQSQILVIGDPMNIGRYKTATL